MSQNGKAASLVAAASTSNVAPLASPTLKPPPLSLVATGAGGLFLPGLVFLGGVLAGLLRRSMTMAGVQCTSYSGIRAFSSARCQLGLTGPAAGRASRILRGQ